MKQVTVERSLLYSYYEAIISSRRESQIGLGIGRTALLVKNTTLARLTRKLDTFP